MPGHNANHFTEKKRNPCKGLSKKKKPKENKIHKNKYQNFSRN